MSYLEIRNQVKAVYPYPKWYRKVDAMTDQQVFATYQRLVKSGKIKN